ncbi:VOC family protein [Marinicella sediminis]|uniref:VOC family protein n=1 Tax=Marinicella sediminis TaxID=1792834 RepID=A0ABV7JDN3_9GAMM|nr:VOC family protein [Marinicella sediminis]
MVNPFHLAIPVRNITEARDFYLHTLGCRQGRSSDHWVDLDLYGHQLVCHLDETLGDEGQVRLIKNDVDDHGVPVPHFGVVLNMTDWQALADRLTTAGVEFIIEPYVRFKGQPGEQATLFFLDPSGNALEFKAFKDWSQLFAVD